MAYYAGDLRTPITIQKRVEGEVDKYGRRSVTWENFAEVLAKVADVGAREYYAAAAVQMENTVSFTTRWIPCVNSSMRLVCIGNVYEIKEVNHLGYRGDFMTLKCVRVNAEGGAADA